MAEKTKEIPPSTSVFVNVLMHKRIAEMLDGMVKEDDTDRSKLVRKLIVNEWRKRERSKSKLVAGVSFS